MRASALHAVILTATVRRAGVTPEDRVCLLASLWSGWIRRKKAPPYALIESALLVDLMARVLGHGAERVSVVRYGLLYSFLDEHFERSDWPWSLVSVVPRVA